MKTSTESVRQIPMRRNRMPTREALADARQMAGIAGARARLLAASAVRDRRAEELRQVLHDATAPVRMGDTTYRETS